MITDLTDKVKILSEISDFGRVATEAKLLIYNQRSLSWESTICFLEKSKTIEK